MGRDKNIGSKEARRIITDMRENPHNWIPVGSPVIKPALAKKYNISKTQVKNSDKRIGENLLNALEHSLLGTTIIHWEPIHVLYKDMLNEFEDVTFDALIESLIRLFNSGYIDCQIVEDLTRPVKILTKNMLLKHYGNGLSDDDINIYPKVAVHEFKATPKGKDEEAKDIYNVYYSD